MTAERGACVCCAIVSLFIVVIVWLLHDSPKVEYFERSHQKKAKRRRSNHVQACEIPRPTFASSFILLEHRALSGLSSSRYSCDKRTQPFVEGLFPILGPFISSLFGQSPFCVHPKTGRVCIPFDPLKDFDPLSAPKLEDVSNHIPSALVSCLHESVTLFSCQQLIRELDSGTPASETGLARHIKFFKSFCPQVFEHPAAFQLFYRETFLSPLLANAPRRRARNAGDMEDFGSGGQGVRARH